MRGRRRPAGGQTPDDLADRFCLAGTLDEVARRIRADVLPSGINHLVLARTDRRLARDWAGLDLPGLPALDEQIRLIGSRIVPALTEEAQPPLARPT